MKQSQASLFEQLMQVRALANQKGFYDAADFITSQLEAIEAKAGDACPNCGSDNIANEGPEEDESLEMTCHNCSHQWQLDMTQKWTAKANLNCPEEFEVYCNEILVCHVHMSDFAVFKKALKYSIEIIPVHFKANNG